MTLKVLTHVWEHYPEGGSKLLVMLALADYAGQDDGSQIYPSMQSLAQKCRMSKRQVQRVVGELVESGALELVRKGSSMAGNKPNLYKIDMPGGGDNMSPQGRQIGSKGVTSTVKRGDIAMSPYPKEPNKPNRVTNSVSEWNQESENRIVQLAGYIRSLKAMPENNRPPGELERAEGELNELRLRAGDL